MSIIAMILAVLATFVAFVLHFLGAWVSENIGTMTMDELMFQLNMPVKGTDSGIVNSIVNYCLWPTLIATAITLILMIVLNGTIHLKTKKHDYKINLRYILAAAFIGLDVFVGLTAWNTFDAEYGVTDYFKGANRTSTFYQDEYVDPKTVTVTFPEKKRNLVHIYLESMESTYADVTSGGGQPESLIPGLTELAREGINFSNTDKLGGAIPAPGTNWTVAGLTAQNSGTTLKIANNIYGLNEDFMPGIYSIGDLLEDNGYQNIFVLGSDATFGGRRTFYTQHGNYKIKDHLAAKADGFIPDDHNVFWGMEDSLVFAYAKQQIQTAASSGQPFNVEILTTATHFPNGFREADCVSPFGDAYSSAIYCSDAQVYAFVRWLQAQPFYENTTVVVTGDHLSMADNAIFRTGVGRTVYNAYLNSAVEPVSGAVKDRVFCTYDIYPTTVAALGAKIEGERLALGTNLFSGEKTLTERNEPGHVFEELAATSNFYNLVLSYDRTLKIGTD